MHDTIYDLAEVARLQGLKPPYVIVEVEYLMELEKSTAQLQHMQTKSTLKLTSLQNKIARYKKQRKSTALRLGRQKRELTRQKRELKRYTSDINSIKLQSRLDRAKLRSRLDRAKRQLRMVQNSYSYRITAPLRLIVRTIKKVLKKGGISRV